MSSRRQRRTGQGLVESCRLRLRQLVGPRIWVLFQAYPGLVPLFDGPQPVSDFKHRGMPTAMNVYPCRVGLHLIPAPSAEHAAAADEQNYNNDDEKCCDTHVRLLRSTRPSPSRLLDDALLAMALRPSSTSRTAFGSFRRKGPCFGGPGIVFW